MNGYQLSADPRHRQGGREIAAEEKPPMGPPDTGREDPEVEEQLCGWAPSALHKAETRAGVQSAEEYRRVARSSVGVTPNFEAW